MLLYQPIDGYRYNSDSLFLYDFVSGFTPKGRLLDIGCGVGIISLLLSRDFDIESTIIDKQELMLSYAELNYSTNQTKMHKHLGDISEYHSDKKFDFIISNPPFYDSSVVQTQHQHLNIARYSHHMPIDSLISSARRLLSPRGYFIFCYDAKQVDVLLQELRESKLNPESIRFVHPKIDREAKLVMIATRSGSKSMTKILPPLIIQDQNHSYLPSTQQIFDKADTYSIKAEMELPLPNQLTT